MADQPTGNGAPKAPTGEGGTPEAVTVDMVNEIVSKAISARNKQIESKIEKSLSDFSSKLDEKFAALKIDTPPAGSSGDPPKPSDIENHPLVKGLQKQIADQKTATEQIKAERDAEKARVRDQVLRTKLTDELTKGGIDPRYVRHAVGVLVDAEKRVRFAADDADDLVFKDATGDVDLGTGLKGWLKSEDAKIFMPPRGTQGSGDRPGSKTTTNGAPTTSLGSTLLRMGMAAPQSGRDT